MANFYLFDSTKLISSARNIYRARLLNKLRPLIFVLLGLLPCKDIYALTLGGYNFVASPGTFTPIAGTPGAVNITGTATDQWSSAVPLNFTFTFAGTTYTSVYENDNGFMTFTANTGNADTWTNGLANAYHASWYPLIAPFWDDIQFGTGGTISYITTGMAPNRVFTMEWLNMPWVYPSPNVNAPCISFQVKLYEGSNNIQFIYRPEAAAPGNGPSASIGIAAGVNSFMSVQNTSSTATASTTTDVANITTKPAAGQIYEFDACNAATISTQPAATAAVCAGGNTSFSVTATSASPLTYQWQVNTGSGTFANIGDTGVYTGTAAAMLNITNARANMNSYSYRVIVSGSCTAGTISSTTALTVNSLPAITTQPTGTAVCPGSSTTFTVAATGTGATYQWQVNTGNGTFANVSGAAYTGGTTTTLHVTPTVAMNNYQYQAVVSGTCMPPATSAIALLQVYTAPIITTQPADKVICLGSTGSLSVVSSGSLSYQWQENTGNGTFTNITDGGVYAGSGTATLSLINPPLYMNGYSYRVVIGGACSFNTTSASAALTVSLVASPTITALGNTTFCPGSSVMISATPDPSLTYQWQLDNDDINSNGTTASYTASDTGAYTLVATDVNGCSGTSNPVTVSFLAAPPAVITAAGPVSFCQGNNVTLSANSGSGYTYYWKQNGNYISNATGTSYVATTSGSYTIDESNGTCNTISSPIVVTVNAMPTVTLLADITSFCPGGSVVLNTNSTPGVSFQWEKNGATINATGNAYIAAAAGTYSVVVTDGNNCTDTSSSVVLTVNAVPDATISLGGGQHTICYNSALALQANTGSGLSYQWFYNNYPVTNATSPVYAASDAGTYSVDVTNVSGCKASSTPVSLSTDVPLNPVLTVNGTNFCTGPFISYKWYYNNQVISGATSACYTATKDGTYAVEVFDGAGCSKMSDTYSMTKVGVDNVVPAQSVSIYPNPASSVLHIDAPVAVNVSITSLDGRVVLQQSHAKDINISNLAAGIYMAGIYSEDNTLIKMEKVVVGK